MRLLSLYSDCQVKIESANNDKVYSSLNLLKNKPQIKADERRFIDSTSEFITLSLTKLNSRSNYS